MPRRLVLPARSDATLPSSAPNTDATFTVVVRVNSDVPAKAFIVNFARVSTATPDPVPTNNFFTAVSFTPALASCRFCKHFHPPAGRRG